MQLLPGVRLGPYEIVSAVGAGGMGEVYRARDTKLGRDVAIKILPRAFTSDPDRLARFEREARALASVNHPNIGAIYGFEEHDPSPGSGQAAVRTLVLELVEGETLADRIRRGPLPVKDGLSVAHQIADALEAAHEKGIVHRDLKPANIKITPDGVVKVLDFGLAKAASGNGADPDLTQSPTVTMGGTGEGVILGTAAYMSPEQARGQAVDKRTDIWAFGCVLYEMLTARAPFAGNTISDMIAAILEREPDWTALPAATPAPIRRLLLRCLDKDAKRRLRDIGDARTEIDDVSSGATTLPSATAAIAPRNARSPWSWPLTKTAALAVIVALTAAVTMWIGARSRPTSFAPETRLDIVTPPTTEPASIAISPDGRTVVFAATAQGQSGLWLRALDAVSARPLPGTNGATYPFWSPNSGSIGFFADGRLKRIDIAGGAAQTLAEATLGLGGAWSRDGTILFSPRPVGPLLRVSATSGAPSVHTRVEPRQSGHLFPQLLPDGIHFLYFVTGSPDVRGVYIGGHDGSTAPRLLDVASAAVYSVSGHVLFVREDTLFAQPLDPVRFELTGSPVRVADGVAVAVVPGYGSPASAVSASSAGPIVYRSRSGAGRQLIWFDRSGREIARVGNPIATQREDSLASSLSPDGRQVALDRTVDGNRDIWLLDLERSGLSRYTVHAADETQATWSPDGSRLVFSSNRNGVVDMFQKSVAGGGEELPLLTTQAKGAATLGNWVSDWSLDGRFLLYAHGAGPKTLLDIWAWPLDAKEEPFPVVQTASEDTHGQFAPNGLWIAYQSNESGRVEVYVRPFRNVGSQRLVSTGGGTHPRWRRDGKELFYVGLDGRLIAVPIQFASDGRSVEAGIPVPLFPTQMGGPRQYFKTEYEVSRDGQRFLIDTPTEAPSSPITVILNWTPKP